MLRLFPSVQRLPGYSLLAVVLAALLAPHVAPAAPGESARRMTATLQVSQIYPPNAWQPVVLQLRNDADSPVDGAVTISTAQPKAPAVARLPLTVPPHSSVRASVWVQFPPVAQRKKGPTPPLAVAEWRSADGALLARADMLGVPQTAVIESDVQDSSAEAQEVDEGAEMFLVVNQLADVDDESNDVGALIGRLKEFEGVAHTSASVELSGLPSQAAGLRAFKAVMLQGVDPESLDVAQRAAVLEYLRGGGTVVVCAPAVTSLRGGGWLGELFPVRLVGTRLAHQIETAPGGTALKLRKPTTIVEAQETPGGQVLLRDRDYVHVAVRPVGLGSVVFTSFPVNALLESQPQVAVLWEQLLSLKRPQWEWKRTQLDTVRHEVLGTMIGQKVAPWSVAAGVAAGYLVLILIAQGLFLGPSRPKAFAATVGIALLLSGALLLTGMTRTRDTSLQSARLAVLDIAPSGGGWRQESVAFGGIDDPKMPLRAAREDVFVRPAMADSSNPPIVRQQPFAVEAAGTFAQRVERVWEASGPADAKQSIAAVASFGAGGLTLNVDNGMGQPIQSPLLVWQGRALAMDDLPISTSHVTSFRTNALGDFTSASMVASDDAKRRGRIVRASLTPPKSMMTRPEPGNALPLLVGWISEDADKALISPPDGKVQISKSMVMVRTPVRIEPAQPGAKLSVPAALVNMNMGRLPYELDKGESVATQQPGEWLISFGVPNEVGKVRPTRVVLDARVTLPAHVMTISKNQCVDGTPKTNRTAAPVAEWRAQVGPQHLEFTCAPGDFDNDGRVWLLLDVRPPQGTPGAVAWQIQGLEVSIEADAVAPPEPISLEAPPNRMREEEVK